VTIPFGKSGLLRGNLFVHNHPGSESFSIEDIWILLRHGVREVHAYGPQRSFRVIASAEMRRFGSGQDAAGWAELGMAYRRAVAASDARFKRYVRAGMFTEADAWAAQTHGAVRKLSAHFRFAYQEI
jgi:hypothetical protein